MSNTPIINTRREALKLWRDILRTLRLFKHVRNKDGAPMRKILRNSARKEFEKGREESNPEEIARLLLIGRDCLMNIQEQIAEKHKRVVTGFMRSQDDHAPLERGGIPLRTH